MMNKLKLSIEKKINEINNAMNQVDSINELSPLVSKFNKENYLSINEKDLIILKQFLVDGYSMTSLELSVIEFISSLGEYAKKILSSDNFLNDSQLECLENIKNKIILVSESYNNENKNKLLNSLNKYKLLLSKLDSNDMHLINEFDIINELLNDGSYSLDDKVNVYKIINSLNSKVFNNYNLSIEDDDIILSEDDLVETNLEYDKLKDLFDKFGIDWSKDDYKINDQKVLENIIKVRNNFIDKLLKYGDYDKMFSMLSFIRDKDLSFVFDLPEILTKTLLYTSVDKLSEFIDKITDNGLDYRVVLKEQPSNFIPPIMEKRKTRGKKGGNSDSRNITGSLNNFISNVEFLNNHNFPVEEVYHDCKSFFIKKPDTVKRIYNKLRMYGISFWYLNGRVKNAFSVLNTYDVLDRLDVAIECGCYDYISNNVTKLIDPNFNMFRIKYAKSEKVSDDEIFKVMKSKGNDTIIMRSEFSSNKNNKYGNTFGETFNLYNAVSIYDYMNSDCIKSFDLILSNSQNDRISDISLNDFLISKLDVYKDPDNDLIYNFDGVIISRLKVLRLYQTLISDTSVESNRVALFYAIVRNSMLNEEEINKINLCLNNISYKRRELI